ncbi:MAG: flagellar motor switch protein FliN [Bacillota bacterium]|nr:flagellar motor switch protein FliN [Bacillota bacterium]MDW7682987.1 flagellar motor switch protein FliN [Bacillota bacterium]
MSDALLSQEEIDALLKEMPTGQQEPKLQPPEQPGSKPGMSLRAAPRPAPATATMNRHPNLERVLDIPLGITVNLGQTSRPIMDVVSLMPGAIVEFDRSVGDPVDIVLNGKLIARGEVVVIDEHFGVRITQIVSPQERVQKMASV